MNIKKRKDRAKRRKNEKDEEENGQDDDEDDQVNRMGARTMKSTGTDAFEDAIYGSESEIDTDDEDAPQQPTMTGSNITKPKKLTGKSLR